MERQRPKLRKTNWSSNCVVANLIVLTPVRFVVEISGSLNHVHQAFNHHAQRGGLSLQIGCRS